MTYSGRRDVRRGPGVLADLTDWLNNPECTAYLAFAKLLKLLDRQLFGARSTGM